MKYFLNDLTIFVISTGENTIKECLDSLKNQTCDFQIEIIKDISPMSKAFQEMPNRCKTKYFVQVDADMVLYPNAIIDLYKSIKNSFPLVYRISAQLYEEGFGVGGSVKCWKKSIFRFFSFRDVRTVDRDFHNRVKKFGFFYKYIKKVVGTHKPRHSNFSFYLKAKSDIEKWRFLDRDVYKYALPLFDNVTNKESVNHFQLLGILLGTLTPYKRVIKSKNFEVEFKRFKIISELIEDVNNLVYENNLRDIFIDAYEYGSNDEKFNQILLDGLINQFKIKLQNLTKLKECILL